MLPIKGLELHPEFNGTVAAALSQSDGAALFALYMAMQNPDASAQPYVFSVPTDHHVSKPVSDYPASHLAATADDWVSSATLTSLIQQGHIDSARLWQAMHPQPLAVKNDPKHLSAEVVSNCALYTQQRLQAGTGRQAVHEDPLQLLNVLDALHQAA